MSNPAIALLDMELAELDEKWFSMIRQEQRLERWIMEGRAVYQQELEREISV